VKFCLKDRPVNPYWVPRWPSLELSRFNPRRHGRLYGAPGEARLLASIMGHNLCCDCFGGPTPEEEKAGRTGHGEAPVTEWRIRRITRRAGQVELVYGATLPESRLQVERVIVLKKDRSCAEVTETVTNLTATDRPVGICQHVTIGRPFLKKGVTVFDLPGGWSQVFPGSFSKGQRLKSSAVFQWPFAPRRQGGKVDLRIAPAEKKNSDFTTTQFQLKNDDAWFTAFNPESGLCFGYIFRRSDFPWLGNWEENYFRAQRPWQGQELTRGMEFSTTPFPTGRRQMVELGRLNGSPALRWVPARSKITYRYDIFVAVTPSGFCGVNQVKRAGAKIKITGRRGEKISV
jgi:hypothetical protein